MGIGITWNCDLDWDFEKYCLPEYKFRMLDTYGWNFRHALYHEENRRTLIKAHWFTFEFGRLFLRFRLVCTVRHHVLQHFANEGPF